MRIHYCMIARYVSTDISLTFNFLLSILASIMDLLRTFIAFELPDHIQIELSKFIKLLQQANPYKIRWIPSQNIHLTAKFLGETRMADIPKISALIDQFASNASIQKIIPGKIGSFPNLSNIRVIWLGLSVPEALIQQIDLLENEMEIHGFEREKRGFTPHLTLGRATLQPHSMQMRNLAHSLQTMKPPNIEPFEINSITLFKSELRPTGAEYTSIHKSMFSS